MASYFRPLLFTSTCLSVLAASPVGRAAPEHPEESTRITAAANVTLRAAPSADAVAVAQVPLGTEVAVASPEGLDKTWIRVRLADGHEGWLLSRLALPLDPVWRWPTFDRIVADRLGRKGDGFPALVELVAFIDRIRPEYTDPDGRAQVELWRLQAMTSALDSIPFGRDGREPYASWLAARNAEVVHDEPGGRWILADAGIWHLHLRHQATTFADDIAWFAVGNGLPGECEGYLPCYLDARNRLHGEYLRRHPAGRHAAEAVGVIRSTAEALAVPASPHAAYDFNRARDCHDATKSLDALSAAVKQTRAAEKAVAEAALERLRRELGCGESGRPGSLAQTVPTWTAAGRIPGTRR